MSPARTQRFLRWSAALTLVGLGLMLWSIFEPRAMPVVLAMSVGQGIGTLAFAMFGWVVLMDLRRTRALARHALARGGSVPEDGGDREGVSPRAASPDHKEPAADVKPASSDVKPASSDVKPASSDVKPALRGEPS
jgi:hypothetical protein